MPSTKLTSTPKTYAQLRDAVVAVVVQGRRAIDRAWLETYHETGRLINEHILQFRDRADYGGKIYEKLTEDTAISVRTLLVLAMGIIDVYGPPAGFVALAAILVLALAGVLLSRESVRPAAITVPAAA